MSGPWKLTAVVTRCTLFAAYRLWIWNGLLGERMSISALEAPWNSRGVLPTSGTSEGNSISAAGSRQLPEARIHQRQ